MQAQVIKLRENGRKLPKDTHQKPLEGDLELAQYRGNRWGYSCLTLVSTVNTGMRKITGQLLEPRLIDLQGNCITFQGFERTDKGQTFHQRWKVLVSGQ